MIPLEIQKHSHLNNVHSCLKCQNFFQHQHIQKIIILFDHLDEAYDHQLLCYLQVQIHLIIVSMIRIKYVMIYPEEILEIKLHLQQNILDLEKQNNIFKHNYLFLFCIFFFDKTNEIRIKFDYDKYYFL